MSGKLDQPASPQIREAVLRLVETIGEPGTVLKLAISRQTVARVLAGRPVRSGTLAAVREGLATSSRAVAS